MLIRLLDLLTSVLIFLAVLFSPWALGSLPMWAVNVMNGLGCTLGCLWLFKLVVSRIDPESRVKPAARPHFTVWMLAVTTLLVLLYCLISAANARVTYLPKTWEFQYHPVITWLPHSYDSDLSWMILWQSLGLAGLFWSLRDWLLAPGAQHDSQLAASPAADELGNSRAAKPSVRPSIRLPSRLRCLLWILAVSGALLAIQGLLQRFGGGHKVLWLEDVKVGNDEATAFTPFGAFPYRAHAAQYFNLLWPLILAFFWTEMTFARSAALSGRSARPKGLGFLIIGVIFMAVCPLMAGSRTGAFVAVLNIILAVIVLLLTRQKQDSKLQWLVPAIAVVILAGGCILGWNSVIQRFNYLSVDAAARAAITQVGREMTADNPWFGTGPGSSPTVYQFYMHDWGDFWPEHLHNDWEEILATFGWVGFSLILLCLLMAFAHWFYARGIPAEKVFVRLLWISLAGCLLHARFDWPFECHSVLTLFIVICAILSCLSWKPARI